jgi:hypothetical protein
MESEEVAIFGADVNQTISNGGAGRYTSAVVYPDELAGTADQLTTCNRLMLTEEGFRAS